MAFAAGHLDRWKTADLRAGRVPEGLGRDVGAGTDDQEASPPLRSSSISAIRMGTV